MYGEALGATAKSVLHLQKDRCFKEQKICSNSSTLPAGDDVLWAQGVSVRSVLHLQKTRSLRSKKSAAALQHFYFLLGMMCHGAWDVPARSVLHLQKTRCLEGAGKAALELDAACPSLTHFQFHVYSNASCGRQFQTSRRFFGPYKKQRGLQNSRSTPAGTASRPFNQNPPSKTPSRPLNPESPSETPLHPFNQNPPSETPSRPSPRIPHPKPPHTTQPRISNLPSKSSLFY